MDFELSDDQRAFQEAVRKFLQANSSSADVRRFLDGSASYDRRVWASMAHELGLHGLVVADEHGGAGAGFLELALVLEEMGRAMLCAPFFATVVLAGTALRCANDSAAEQAWLPKIATGDVVATLALVDADGPTTARRTSRGWALNGRKTFVMDGVSADLVLVTAETGAGLSLFAVRAPADGLTCTPLPVLDPTRPLAQLDFDRVDASLVGSDGGAAEPLARTMDLAAIGLAAEQLGGAQACLDMAVAYAGSRVQFGRPIGSFQAIKHKCADMFVDVETSRCAVYVAAWSVDNDPDDLPLLADMTGSFASDAFYRSAATNLQIHGGIGYTWEHDAQLYFKRATASARILALPSARRESVAHRIGL